MPNSRFKDYKGNDFPEWEEKLYDRVYSFKNTNSYSRDQLSYQEGIIRNIHYGDIHTKFKSNFYLQHAQVPFVKPEVDLSRVSADSYCQEGDLVIADASEDYDDVGKCVEIRDLNGEQTLAGLHTFVARPSNDSIASGFGGYLMQSRSVRLQIMTIAQGTKVLGIAKTRLGKIKLLIPSHEEQSKIADFLSSVDNRIDQLTEKKALLEEYKKGVMQKLFSQEIRFKDDKGEDFPEWDWKKLGDVGNIVGGGTPDSTINSYWRGEVQWFTPSEIQSKYVSNSKRTISHSGLGKCSASMLPVGSLLMTSRATIAEISISTKPCATNQGFQSITVNPEVSNEFIYYWIVQFKKEFLRKAQGSTFLEIGGKEVRKMPISLPSLSEQNKIATFLSTIDQKIKSTSVQINETQSFKKGLLQQMFV